MKKKLIVLFILIISILLLSACNKHAIYGIDNEMKSEEAQADARVEEIVTALNEEDADSIKSLFSKKALEDAVDFDENLDDLLENFDGNITTWERDGLSSSETISDGRESLMSRYSINITAGDEEYLFFVIDYSKNTIEPDKQGLYMLELIKYTDEKDLESWQERMRAGIYIH